MTTCSSAAYGTRHRRGGAAPDGAPSSAIRIRAVVPAPHSHVAKCSIFVARGPGGLLPFATSSSLTRRQRPRTHSRTHPQHARTHRHRKRSVIAFSLFHAQPPALLPPHSRFAARPAAFLFFFRVPTLFLAGRSFFFFLLRVASAAPSFCLLSRCAARHAYPQTKTRSLARTPTIDGRTTRRAVRRHG
jgi:hypothetical protein